MASGGKWSTTRAETTCSGPSFTRCASWSAAVRFQGSLLQPGGTAAGIEVAELEVAFGAVAIGRQCRSSSVGVCSLTNKIVTGGFGARFVVGIYSPTDSATRDTLAFFSPCLVPRQKIPTPTCSWRLNVVWMRSVAARLYPTQMFPPTPTPTLTKNDASEERNTCHIRWPVASYQAHTESRTRRRVGAQKKTERNLATRHQAQKQAAERPKVTERRMWLQGALPRHLIDRACAEDGEAS